MRKKNKGLTLMELTIVLALLAIVAAILIPVFLLTTDRSRLRADIQSAHVIQNAMDLYRIERRRSVTGYPHDVEAMVTNLANAGFLNRRNLVIQTEDAEWRIVEVSGASTVVVDIDDSPDDVHRAYESLPDEERVYVRNGRRQI
jgi:prepilin-type N-terminal cleavage/methylation domain-containing protein